MVTMRIQGPRDHSNVHNVTSLEQHTEPPWDILAWKILGDNPPTNLSVLCLVTAGTLVTLGALICVTSCEQWMRSTCCLHRVRKKVLPSWY